MFLQIKKFEFSFLFFFFENMEHSNFYVHLKEGLIIRKNFVLEDLINLKKSFKVAACIFRRKSGP